MQVICPKCKGTGLIAQPVTQTKDPPQAPDLVKCPACLGGGIIDTTATA